MPLTNIQCKAAVCPADRSYVRLTDAFGMYLEVSKAGGKYWRLKYRIGQTEKRLALGVYPTVSLAEAREVRDEARKEIGRGGDPGQQRKQAKLVQFAQQGSTFKAVACEWHEHWQNGKSPRHAAYVLTRLEQDVFPIIGSQAIATVTPMLLVSIAKTIEARGARVIAEKCLQTCGQIFRYAIAHGVVDRNPVQDVKPSETLKSRRKKNYARLSEDELPEFLLKVEAYQGSALTRLAMNLIALTFLRTSELIEAPWSEINFEKAEWRIGAERMKSDRPHIVPLSKQALDVLRTIHTFTRSGHYIFPGVKSPKTHMSNGTILAALKRMGYTGRMTGHGYRGLASTILHEQGLPHHAIEIQLAHIEKNEVSAAYNHALYIPERRKMMQFWADYLDKCRLGQVAKN
jgi:integrase